MTDKFAVRGMVSVLATLPLDEPNISFDMEAKNLGHKSPLCLLQIRDNVNQHSYLVDLLVLSQKDAFDTPGHKTQTTLRDILEDPGRKKLIFDCRQDSCTLFGNAGIKLQGVLDVQIAYHLTNSAPPAYRSGLKLVVERTSGMSEDEYTDWVSGKNRGPNHEQWQNRPIGPVNLAYALGDVKPLLQMYKNITERLNDEGKMWVEKWTAIEIERTWCKPENWKSSGKYTSPGFRDCWGRSLDSDYPKIMRVGDPFYEPRPRKTELELEMEWEEERMRREGGWENMM